MARPLAAMDGELASGDETDRGRLCGCGEGAVTSPAGGHPRESTARLSRSFSDTFHKHSKQSLLEQHPSRELIRWITAARDGRQFVALAGSLSLESVPQVIRLGADIIAVRRGSLHDRRTGPICQRKVRIARWQLLYRHPRRTTRDDGVLTAGTTISTKIGDDSFRQNA